MPVPGTGTAVWWEQQIDPTLVFGIPMVARLERKTGQRKILQLEPDIRVPNDYKSILSGKDPQLERAVKEMLDEIKEKDKTKKGFKLVEWHSIGLTAHEGICKNKKPHLGWGFLFPIKCICDAMHDRKAYGAFLLLRPILVLQAQRLVMRVLMLPTRCFS